MSATVVEVERAECDACASEAHVEAFVFASHPAWRSSLAFCAHHGTRYLPKLHADQAIIVDHRDQLEADRP